MTDKEYQRFTLNLHVIQKKGNVTVHEHQSSLSHLFGNSNELKSNNILPFRQR